MSPEDHADYDRFKKLLDRLGKPVIMSAEAETSEIIRRRLFEWEPGGLPKDAERTITEYAEWVNEKRSQIPSVVSRRSCPRTIPGLFPVPSERVVGVRAEVAGCRDSSRHAAC